MRIYRNSICILTYLSGWKNTKKFFVSSFSVIFISIITSLVANFFALLFNKSVNNIFLHQSLERFISIVVCQLIILYVYKLTLGIFKKKTRMI